MLLMVIMLMVKGLLVDISLSGSLIADAVMLTTSTTTRLVAIARAQTAIDPNQ